MKGFVHVLISAPPALHLKMSLPAASYEVSKPYFLLDEASFEEFNPKRLKKILHDKEEDDKKIL
jgi:hypothetical protein